MWGFVKERMGRDCLKDFKVLCKGLESWKNLEIVVILDPEESKLDWIELEVWGDWEDVDLSSCNQHLLPFYF